jgi:hypothetical protein
MEGAELKPKPLFAGLVDVAREQLASDVALTDDAIKAALTKSKAEKTLEKEWSTVLKKVEGLITGENPQGLKDTSDAAMKIGELINEHVKAFVVREERQDMIELLMERGYTRAQSEAIADKK